MRQRDTLQVEWETDFDMNDFVVRGFFYHVRPCIDRLCLSRAVVCSPLVRPPCGLQTAFFCVLADSLPLSRSPLHFAGAADRDRNSILRWILQCQMHGDRSKTVDLGKLNPVRAICCLNI
jgi:hypothetical protein